MNNLDFKEKICAIGGVIVYLGLILYAGEVIKVPSYKPLNPC